MRLEPKPAPSHRRHAALPASRQSSLTLAHHVAAGACRRRLAVFRVLPRRKGAAGSQFALLETLTRATPLIFTGLAVAVAFRAKLWNIGAEAQLYIGGVVTVVLGTGALPLPSFLLIPIIMVAAMAAGALLLLGPAVLKTRFGVDEVVTTLLLNFIVLLFVSMLLEGPLKDPMGLGWPQSPKVIAEAQLPRIIQGKRLHYGFVIALVSAVIVWVIMKKTVLGYEMRAVGHNPQAAGFAGIPVNRVLMKTALLSGGLAALAGFSEVSGPQGQPHPRSVAGLRLFRHRRGHARHAQPARRRRLGDLRRRHLRRRRRHEPLGRRAELHRRRHGRDRAAHHGRRDPASRVTG